MKHNAHAPTIDQLAEGPLVTLARPGWGNYTWSPHGFLYNIRFTNGKATILADHFDEWIGEEGAAVYGITVTRGDTTIGCPVCGATGDDPCVTKMGKPTKRHRKRS